jgi:hypothetical protein
MDTAIPPLPPALYAKLQLIAEPFVDTPLTAIEKAVDFYLAHKSTLGAPAQGHTTITNSSVMIFPADTPPDLAFTKPQSIKLEDTTFVKSDCYWNTLLYEVVRRAGKKLHDLSALKPLLLCNHKDGEHVGAGYHYIEDAGLSVQGQAANGAWKTIIHLAKALGIAVSVTFVWEDNVKAQYPGKTCKMTFPGE